MKIMILIIALLYSGLSLADEQRGSNIPQHIATALILMDWSLALDIKNHTNVIESNKWLGNTPTRGNINKYSIAKLFIHYLANKTKHRNAWNITTIAFTFYGVKNSLGLGLHFSF